MNVESRPAQNGTASTNGWAAEIILRRRPAPPWHVTATAVLVTGRRGHRRLVLLVACRCGCTHLHTAALPFVDGSRRHAPCGARYRVHAVDTAATVA